MLWCQTRKIILAKDADGAQRSHIRDPNRPNLGRSRLHLRPVRLIARNPDRYVAGRRLWWLMLASADIYSIGEGARHRSCWLLVGFNVNSESPERSASDSGDRLTRVTEIAADRLTFHGYLNSRTQDHMDCAAWFQEENFERDAFGNLGMRFADDMEISTRTE